MSNEETGVATESFVNKVLREGRIVGLASYTRLTSKDHRQIPIEDSTAPIRDAKGNIIGVVLVFRDITRRREAERVQKRRVSAIHCGGGSSDGFTH